MCPCAGELEWIYANTGKGTLPGSQPRSPNVGPSQRLTDCVAVCLGYTYAGQDYGGNTGIVTGNGQFVRRKSCTDCQACSWTMTLESFDPVVFW